MSSRNLGRIKQIKQKQNGVFPSVGVPIGTDGFLVDMLSQLDLEEELKLGGNHYVKITQDSNTTTIKEWFLSQPKGTNVSIEDVDQNIVIYTCITFIRDQIDRNPVQIIDQDNNSIVTQTNDYIVTGQAVEVSRRTEITTNLYKGLYKSSNPIDNFLHQKITSIAEDNDGVITVDQILY